VPKSTRPGVPKLRKPKSFPLLNDKKKFRVNAAQEEQKSCKKEALKLIHPTDMEILQFST
jgi:hypothetical protein